MTHKLMPFNREKLEQICSKYPTPFHLYDEKNIRLNARALNKAFAWNKGFKEYYAVKACPNPFIIKLLKEEGFGTDCSSLPEMLMSEQIGITGEGIMFTSNNTPADEMIAAKKMGAIINLDDISHISFLEKHAGIPELICLRYNPGALKKGNAIIGHPEEAKYGFTRDQIIEGYRILRDKEIKRFGLHTMVASNELNADYFIETANILFTLLLEIHQKLGIRFEFINLGGGIGIPYKPEDKPVDLDYVSKGIKDLYDKIIVAHGLDPVKIYLEAGRMITGPYGYLVSKVQHVKKTYKNYVGLDASMQNLMRPALYGAYHHITVIGKELVSHDQMYDVTGSLCENNDKFAINRKLPLVEPNDLVVIHDTGAHGYAMGFNYNAKLRSAEVLLRENGDTVLIRRAETIADYMVTLDMQAVKQFKV